MGLTPYFRSYMECLHCLCTAWQFPFPGRITHLMCDHYRMLELCRVHILKNLTQVFQKA